MNEKMKSPANFDRLVLGCIEPDVCKQMSNTRVKALDEIYKIYRLLHRSDLKISEKKSSEINFLKNEY